MRKQTVECILFLPIVIIHKKKARTAATSSGSPADAIGLSRKGWNAHKKSAEQLKFG